MPNKDYEFPLSSQGVEGWTREIFGEVALYWVQREGAGNGFEFKAFDWTTGSSYAPGEHITEYDCMYDDPGVIVSNLVRGWAAFDGIRDLDWGHYGNLNYPWMRDIHALLARLIELEDRFCPDTKNRPRS